MSKDDTLDILRKQGYEIGEPYVQDRPAPNCGMMFVIVDGVAMTQSQAEALAKKRVTLAKIAKKNSGPQADRPA